MGFWQDITGQTAADASRAAASDTYQKQAGAIADLKAYGNDYADKFAGLAQGYNPYVQTGYAANNQLQGLLTDPNSLSNLPGYQFALTQGLNAVDRGAAARSGVQNGATIKAEQRYGTGLADSTYGNQLQRLLAASGAGAGWLGAQNATTGQGLQGQLATRQSGFNGAMTASGTIGQGDVAAANAEAAGSQNLLNTGLKIGGALLGVPTGLPFGMGNSGGSSYGVYGSGVGSGGNNGGPVWGI